MAYLFQLFIPEELGNWLSSVVSSSRSLLILHKHFLSQIESHIYIFFLLQVRTTALGDDILSSE